MWVSIFLCVVAVLFVIRFEAHEFEIQRLVEERDWYRDALHQEVESRQHIQRLLHTAQEKLRSAVRSGVK